MSIPKTAAKTTSDSAKAVATKRVARPSRKRREPGVRAVLQPDGVSCGWATTKWLLDSFGVLDVTDRQLRTELNTDADRGVRAWWNSRIAPFVGRKFGKDWEAGEGTLPMAIFSALRKRGIVLKNPIRLERFSNFTDYLYDTFREGGRAAILLWRMDGLLHWMGVDRQKGVIRIMDPARGRYVPFQRGIEYWESGDRKPDFLVFGFVRKAAKQQSEANVVPTIGKAGSAGKLGDKPNNVAQKPKSTKTGSSNMDAQSQSEALVQWVVEKLAPSGVAPRRVLHRSFARMKAAAPRKDNTGVTRNGSIRSDLAFVFNRFAEYDLVRLCWDKLSYCHEDTFEIDLPSLKAEQMEAADLLYAIATDTHPNARLQHRLFWFCKGVFFYRGIVVVGIEIHSRRSGVRKDKPSFLASLFGKSRGSNKSRAGDSTARPVRDFAWIGLYEGKNLETMVIDPERARPCRLSAWLAENDFGFDRVNTDQTRPSNGLVFLGVGRPKRKGKAKNDRRR